MALFNKLFTSHKRKNVQPTDATGFQKPRTSIFPFSNNQVRIVLYRECDMKGRRLLFDSSAIQKVHLEATPIKDDKNGPNPNGKCHKNYIEVSNGYGYRYARPEMDYNTIGEMIFGSVAMSFRGTSLKVHWLQRPNRILCSQVFLSPSNPNGRRRSSTNNTSSDFGSFDTCSLNSFTLSLSLCTSDNLSSFQIKKQTNPLDVPESVETESTDGTRSFDFSGCDSGYCGTDPWNTSCSSYCPRSSRSSMASIYSTDQTNVSRKLSIDSSINADVPGSGCGDVGLQRRIMRNLSTSFENNLSGSDLVGYFGDSAQQNAPANCMINRRRYSDQTECRSNPEMVRTRKGASKDSLRPPPPHFSSYTPKTKSSMRRSKIGLAICITFSDAVEDEMQIFCAEHIALLESMLCRLRAMAESAYVNQKRFHQVMLHAWISTATWITDLFTAPRLSEPIWLTLSSGAMENSNRMAQQFMLELSSLLSSADTKDTNFFISTLLTAILTNHLGWVASVAPLHNCSTNQSTASATEQTRAKMSEISKLHPYNALWAQLGDLYGAIGYPTKISTTIICGNESPVMNKLLNVLTYFIRCGEIRRAADYEIIDQDLISDILRDMKSDSNEQPSGLMTKTKGLTRTATCLKDLTTEMLANSSDASKEKIIMNDIPNVLAFRNSRFVQQELRIGNYSMDTGIEMDQQQRGKIEAYQVKMPVDAIGIKLTVTNVDNDEFECEAASEAIDYVLKKKDENWGEINSLSHLITANSLGSTKTLPVKLLWGIEPVKEGIIEEQWQHVKKNPQSQSSNTLNNTFPEMKTENTDHNGAELKRSESLFAKSVTVLKKKRIRKPSQESISYHSDVEPGDIHTEATNLKSFSSLSDLITANSVGVSDRLVWGIEPVKEGICHEEEKHFEIAKKRIEMEHDLNPNSNVVFMLGDNDVLSGLKSCVSSNESSFSPLVNREDETDTHQKLGVNSSVGVSAVVDSSAPSSTSTFSSPNVDRKKKCTHKKHSGVKFNFEQYPQIVTNYMKNKNLDLADYDFLEKGLKLEGFGASTSMLPGMPLPLNDTKIEEEEEEETCECCANSSRILQTPSNATELEFSSDDISYPPPLTPAQQERTPVKKKPSVGGRSRARFSVENANVEMTSKTLQEDEERKAREFYVINLPIPKSASAKQVAARKPGFVPSLFVGITDHYISDMVLQGTTAPLSSWEPSLKQNLALASHCATFEQTPTENIAIIANIDTWDVKLVSSHSYVLPCGGGTTGSVGMSQLVSTMLESVHAMWSAGLSAYQCMSFLESKLREMYLRSETLAAFLLATEFCSLNSITTALDLSANDVPLLLSVASIHSPQVTKKYGISMV